MNELIKITEFEDFEQKMAEFSARYDAVVYNLDNREEKRQARSDRLAIGKVISRLDRTHKELKAPLKERVDLLDGERKRIKDRLLATQSGIKSQIQAHEERKQAIADALQKRIDAITFLANSEDDLTAADIKARIAEGAAIDPESPEYAPRQADASLAHRQTIRTLMTMLAARENFEAEQAELARLRAEQEKRIREERYERIRQAAEEKAIREAETLAKRKAEEYAERERVLKDMRQRAVREKAESEARARHQQESAARREKELKEEAAKLTQMAANDKREAEKRAQEAAKRAAEQAAQAERDRAERQRQQKAKEAERKASNKKHRESVDNDIMEDLLLLQDGKTLTAISVLEALKANKIRHVAIQY